MNYRECYRSGAARLSEAGIPEAETDARILLEYVCGTDRNDLLAHGDMPVEEEKQARYREWIDRRTRRVPLQMITGEQCFCGLDFFVNEHVLIPRQDTEILVEEALGRLRPGMELLDMCTGSGCILISLLALAEGVRGTGVDISARALEVARRNGSRLLSADRQPRWLQGDLFAALSSVSAACSAGYDMIVSNPPYIADGVIGTLQPEVRDHEPRIALDGGDDGLVFYRRIIGDGRRFLKDGGFLLFEIGYDQGAAVTGLMEKAGFAEVTVRKDYAGLDRVVAGRK